VGRSDHFPFFIEEEKIRVRVFRLNPECSIEGAVKLAALKQQPAVPAFQLVGPVAFVASLFQKSKKSAAVLIQNRPCAFRQVVLKNT